MPQNAGNGAPTRVPRVTIAVFLATAMVTALQFRFPGLNAGLRRTPTMLTAHEWWRLITPVFLNEGGWHAISFNFVSLAVVGTIAERVWGSRRWLIFYVVGAVAGEVAGLLWQPSGAGCSVAVCGLLGALAVWMLLRMPTWQARLGAAVILLGGLALAAASDLHGPPLLVGGGAALQVLGRAERQAKRHGQSRSGT